MAIGGARRDQMRTSKKNSEPNARPVPPYGPAQGMIQGLDLLRRTEPALVDVDYLRNNGVAPGNEYKVVGALKFLGLIDGKGAPTEKARLIRVRGMAFTENLRKIIREAYGELHQQLDISKSTDEVYNYFVLRARLKPEMARKATRFFVQLCQLADLSITDSKVNEEEKKPIQRPQGKKKRRSPTVSTGSQLVFNLTLAVDPALARMEEADLAILVRKIMNVAREVASEPGASLL